MASSPPTSQDVARNSRALTNAASSDKQTLRTFTQDFFAQFGASAHPVGQQPLGPLRVSLADALAQHFGSETLTLAFQQEDVQTLRAAEREQALDDEVAASALDTADAAATLPSRSRTELVAYGSQLFDRMVSYLQRHAALTVQALPTRFRDGETLMQAVRPTNAAIAGLHMWETQQPLYLFNWRITYRADDQREELYTVVLEENGSRLPLLGESVNDEQDERAVDLDALLADAEPAIEQNEAGHSLPLKSPPMTELTRLAASARKYAIYHADLRCASHEAEILPRLHKSLERLTSYYEQQIEEIRDNHDTDGEKRRVLEQDLQRKIAEEVENHRLRVRVDLVSYAILLVPIAIAELTLRSARAPHSLSTVEGNGAHERLHGQQEVVVTVRRNGYSGALRRPRCHACRTETTTVAVDRNGHVTCDDCLRQCAVCREVLCADCGVEPCPVCERKVCDGCGSACWACGERACTEHQSLCPACGDAVCHSCQSECAECGTRQCRSHLRRDSVSGALICGVCAVRCPGCRQFSAQVATDEASGQRFCTDCLVACARCGRRVGPGFFITSAATGQPFCDRCTAPCPTCGTQTPLPERCPTCSATCALCGDLFAHEDAVACAQCEQTYCPRCVDARTELCRTCASLQDGSGESIDLLAEPCGVEPRVVDIAPLYTWRRAENERYLVYEGQGMLAAGGLVVVEKARGDEPPKLLIVRQQGLADLLRRFGRT